MTATAPNATTAAKKASKRVSSSSRSSSTYCVPDAVLLRIIRRAGIRRTTTSLYDEMRDAVAKESNRIVTKALCVCGNRLTLSERDIAFAIEDTKPMFGYVSDRSKKKKSKKTESS